MDSIYAVVPVKMSESPASRTAMVEQRNIFPQAVPSSICNGCQRVNSTLQSHAETASSLGDPEPFGFDTIGFRRRPCGGYSRCYRRSGGRWSWTTWSSLLHLLASLSYRRRSVRLCLHSSSLLRRGGQLPAMMTSLALPERRVLRVDL